MLIEAAHRLFEDPGRSWDSLELDVLARAAQDPELRSLGADRIAQRSAKGR